MSEATRPLARLSDGPVRSDGGSIPTGTPGSSGVPVAVTMRGAHPPAMAD